jgi:hypothetical protein
MKKFCVLARDYEFHVPRSHNIDDVRSSSIIRGLQSLSNQTFKDFDLVICHDGPKEKTYLEEGIDFKSMGLDPIIINTDERMQNYGHYSADAAMRYAYENNLGEYYIQFNIDNEFFPNAFEILNDEINKHDEGVFIFPVHHWKIPGAEGLEFRGIPVVVGNVDAMQVVAHRDIWKEINFWHSDHEWADGIIYEEMFNKYGWVEIPTCLGHNF